MKRLIAITGIMMLATECYGQFNTVTSHSITRQTKTVCSIASEADKDTIQEKERTNRVIGAAYPLHRIHITSPFGQRTDPYTKKKVMHNGLDLRANYEPAYAMFYGRVIHTGKDKNSGIYVTLRHGNITVSYCHLSKIKVKKGDVVFPGDVVTITGNTGRSTAPHLHITCRYKNDFVSPLIIINYVSSAR